MVEVRNLKRACAVARFNSSPSDACLHRREDHAPMKTVWIEGDAVVPPPHTTQEAAEIRRTWRARQQMTDAHLRRLSMR